MYTTAALARFIDYPLPTAIQAFEQPIPTLTTRAVHLEVRADDGAPTYTITYASDSVCGYLSGSVQIPISCENKNRCLWELESFKYIACEIDGETTGIAHTKCLARDEALDANLCDDVCVSNAYNLQCTNDTAPYCRTYAYPRGVRDYRCAPTPATRVSSVDFTYDGQKFPDPIISTVTGVDRPRSSDSSSTTTEAEESSSTATAEAEPNPKKKGLSEGAIGGLIVGVIFGVLFVIGGIWWYRRTHPRGTQANASLSESVPPVGKRSETVVNQRSVQAEDGIEVVEEISTISPSRFTICFAAQLNKIMTMTALSNPSQHVFVDPEYRIFKEMIDIQMQHQSPPPMDTVADIRNATDGMLAMVASTFAYPDGMQESVHFAPSSLPSSCAPHLIPITRYIPIATASATGPQRAILYIHGGGLFAGSVKSFRLWAAEFAERSGTQIFSVDYRLAPGFAIAPSCAKIEPPAPFAVHDVLDALSWLQFLDTASEFGIDPARIVLSGNSAGGAIAAGVALLE
ncbi:hypothetical protein FPSE5266_07341 [Fusarium pseudograminearum]|nr:hypothetical protein FPSE5266_07341 [Fusarium pseudograminearum]